MGFSIKLAPGIRVRASSRGIRTSIGPRAARLHVGGGRTGISTGAGPVSFYSSLGGGRRGATGPSGAARPSPGQYQRMVAAQQRQVAQDQKVEEARRLADTFTHILKLHEAEFPPARRPVAPPPARPDRAEIYRYYEQHAMAGLNVLQRGERAAARQRANAWTDAEAQRRWTILCQRQAQWQQHLDHRWAQLCGNVPEVVIETLQEAFDDNEAPSAAVGVTADEVALAVLVLPETEAIPQRMPGRTDAGNLTLRKLTQKERASFYALYVCGQVLVTVREALAVAPAIRSARVVALRRDGANAYGVPRLSCVLAARFDRERLAGVRWQETDAAAIVNDASTERLINQAGRSGWMQPVDLTGEPDLVRLIDAIDVQELLPEQQ